jgi:hypothetical protein
LKFYTLEEKTPNMLIIAKILGVPATKFYFILKERLGNFSGLKKYISL